MIEAATEAGDPIPEAIQNRPELYSDLLYVWQGFAALNRGRQYLVAVEQIVPMPLSFEAIYYYSRAQGIVGLEEFEEFHHLFRVLDDEYLAMEQEKIKRNQKK